MYQSSELVASARASWLAELEQALADADRLAIELGGEQQQGAELISLRADIVAVRAELGALRRSGLGEIRREIDPDWTNLPTWRVDLAEQREI
ncbi:MAG TPA: hypothetical protein VK485_06950 [Sphingomicrobium sp.]|nr:hypothetical protein [Sphingomicrobium sp.]